MARPAAVAEGVAIGAVTGLAQESSGAADDVARLLGATHVVSGVTRSAADTADGAAAGDSAGDSTRTPATPAEAGEAR